ncbi:MAG: hypothetical protein ACRDJ3_02540 [Solirubrobacteraceae bacterium]|jgi:hypothetical protein
MTTYDIAGRGPGKFRSLRPPTRYAQPRSTGTVRYIQPCPKMPPEQAARLREQLAGLSGWELERIDRRI